MSAYVDSAGVTYLTADIKALADETYPAIAAIAEEYDSTSAYELGDFCIKNGLFYKCNTAISSGGEAWNSAHWTATNVADNLGTKMVILSYGHSTWNEFLAAYKANAVVYCRASSNSNPASGSQTRMAFMAYVNNGTTPTEVEFQYYRSVSSHSVTQQGDQVYVYKLTSGGTWTVTVREASSKVAAGTGLTRTYASGTVTLSADVSALETTLSDAILSNIVNVFSSSSTYDVGEYVLYDGKIYRCTTAITTAGDWDSTSWSEIKLGDEIETINSTKTTLDAVYPVGAIYISTSSTSPASMFGGTWARIKDKFLLSAGDTYAAASTGGSNKHYHTTGGHTLTTSEIPSHTHKINGNTAMYLSSSSTGLYKSSSVTPGTWAQNINSGNNYDGSTGGGGSHSHGNTGETTTLPPYLAVYVWERTA